MSGDSAEIELWRCSTHGYVEEYFHSPATGAAHFCPILATYDESCGLQMDGPFTATIRPAAPQP